MNSNAGLERLAKMLAGAAVHSADSHDPSKRPSGPSSFTIAISRQPSASATAVAQEVGAQLSWPVYDRALIHQVAQTMHQYDGMLESVDERHQSWLQEAFETLLNETHITEFGFTRELVKTLLALAAKGNCVVVGRGASLVLPLRTTLRVRLVAPLDDRINALSVELQIPPKEAARRVEIADREQVGFMKRHFRKDPRDPQNFDLSLNTARFSNAQCAEQIILALHSLQAHTDVEQREGSFTSAELLPAV